MRQTDDDGGQRRIAVDASGRRHQIALYVHVYVDVLFLRFLSAHQPQTGADRVARAAPEAFAQETRQVSRNGRTAAAAAAAAAARCGRCGGCGGAAELRQSLADLLREGGIARRAVDAVLLHLHDDGRVGWRSAQVVVVDDVVDDVDRGRVRRGVQRRGGGGGGRRQAAYLPDAAPDAFAEQFGNSVESICNVQYLVDIVFINLFN